jgi:hypothetical protein
MTSISLFVIHPSGLDRNRQNLAGIAAGESDEQPIEHQVAVSTGAARSDRPGPGVGQWPFF